MVSLPRASQLIYQTNATLRVVRRNSVNGEVQGHEKLKFKLKRPFLDASHIVSFDGNECWASYCVIPGQDPHNIYPKECQDLCFVESDGRNLLVGLYDGHGMHGQDVANFCVDTVKRYFKSRRSDIHVELM